jgi:hypothetical protein
MVTSIVTSTAAVTIVAQAVTDTRVVIVTSIVITSRARAVPVTNTAQVHQVISIEMALAANTTPHPHHPPRTSIAPAPSTEMDTTLPPPPPRINTIPRPLPRRTSIIPLPRLSIGTAHPANTTVQTASTGMEKNLVTKIRSVLTKKRNPLRSKKRNLDLKVQLHLNLSLVSQAPKK